MSTIIRKKNRLDAHKNNALVMMEMIFNWCSTGQLNKNEFWELTNYARQGISNNAKNRNKFPYTGNEDPEIIMG